MFRHVKFNEEKGYYEVVKNEYGRFCKEIHWGIKTEDGKIVVPSGYYTNEEIRMAEWELCVSINKKYEIIGHIASLPNWTVVKEK